MIENNNQEVLSTKKLINELDLSMVGNNMVIKHGWLKSEVEACCTLYKNFLFLKYKYPTEKLAPSEEVDEFWHNHILDTEKYRSDCEKIFGCYLDHYPYVDMDGVSAMDDSKRYFAMTQELHEREFGFSIVGVRYTKFSRLIRKLLGED